MCPTYYQLFMVEVEDAQADPPRCTTCTWRCRWLEDE
jgi:hypothetical protein